MKRRFIGRLAWLVLMMLLIAAPAHAAVPAFPDTGTCKANILVDASTGTVLSEKNADDKLPMASLTKMMTLILAFEAIERGELSLEDSLVISQSAARVGGSTAFLDAGSSYKINDLLLSIVVASANDSATAIAERLSGTEAVFAQRMNEKAQQMGLTNTHFANATGLPTENHYSSARDLAVMAAELMNHPQYFAYSTIWIEEFVHPSGRVTMLTNTNKLLRQGIGVDGVKTGFTNDAGHCLASSGEREGMRLISVVLGATSSKNRFDEGAALLEYGFANYQLVTIEKPVDSPPWSVAVIGGKVSNIVLVPAQRLEMVVERGTAMELQHDIQIPEKVAAPIGQGQRIGTWTITQNGEEKAVIDLVAAETVEKANYGDYLNKIFQRWLSKAA
ncbi:MAG: D-alanyl-D-alanine carboxypeptidase family protein [Christensenellales bacterium]|jgi:D-alanyl-D-alanine carboxypeptidase (penicillin-binding protein 5/6)